MHEQNAAKLLAKVMGWKRLDTVPPFLSSIQLLADFKYDKYQRFRPGKKFVESLALWLNQFRPDDRETALRIVNDHLVFVSELEFSHLVSTAYPDWIVQERIRLVSEERDIPLHRVGEITSHQRFRHLRYTSLYLGLSDGARTNELRRASNGEINNEQIWQAYELGEDKAKDMVDSLQKTLTKVGLDASLPRFNLIWLLDDFSGSGNTYIRYDHKTKRFKGKLKSVYERMLRGDLVDPSHYEVFLMLYTATRQAIDHIEYWAERFTTENGYKPLQVRVLSPIERETSLAYVGDTELQALLNDPSYSDNSVVDDHFKVGGTDKAAMGFAGCALPVVLSHNTPNNSIYLLWGFDYCKPYGLFPRVSRHGDF